MRILVTGATGFIGAHTVIELIDNNFEVVLLDNLSNSKISVIDRLQKIANKELDFVKCDLRKLSDIKDVFAKYKIDAVSHFAGFKSVSESIQKPFSYYENNIGGTINLLHAMSNSGVKRLVFSSSATVYGKAKKLPIQEDSKLKALNPYAESKLVIEQMLNGLCKADNEWKLITLRYFNPVGAHESALIGEDPLDSPNNIMPMISRVALGIEKKLEVFGDDYRTPDGSGIRDYIHVIDLAKGHVAAIQKLFDQNFSEILEINLGTGRGISVFELIEKFTKVSGVNLPFVVAPRRPGDIAESYASVELAKQELSWEATLDLYRMCKDTWNWQKRNFNT